MYQLLVAVGLVLVAPLFAWAAVASSLAVQAAALLAAVWSASLFLALDSALSRFGGPARRVVRMLPPLLLCLPVLYVVGFLAAHLVNDLRLAKFERQLFDHPLPPGATAVERYSWVGVLTGNGDHCDFVVEQLLETSWPVEEIRAYYSALAVQPAIPGGAGGGLPDIQVYRPCCAEDEPIMVSLVDAPYEGIFDIRCL